LLQATVSGQTPGKVLLAIGNRQLSAETSLPLEKGQQLTLQVRSLGAQPVLQIISALKESPLAGIIRLLLPRQAPLTPLLASINQLARLPVPHAPALLTEQVRSTLRQLPDIAAVSTTQGLKKAIADSGIFLEHRLLQSTAARADTPALQSDFKANLLRLIQLLRDWPVDAARTTAGTPAATTQARETGIRIPPAMPPTGKAGASATQPATTTQGTSQTRPPLEPDQLRRMVRASLPGSVATRPGTTPASPVTVRPATSGGTGGPATAMLPGSELPAPLRGTVPVPQSALQASLDLINRLGNFRTDLLLQAEAALARIQLNQLAAVPRESERGLLEWLFELPIRRMDAIDLWSMRLLRDNRGQQYEAQPPSPRWTVQLAFDLPGLGAVQAQVQLRNERISAYFWTEQTDTLPLFNTHLHELRAALGTAGLEVDELDCRHGARPAGHSGSEHPLIRERV